MFTIFKKVLSKRDPILKALLLLEKSANQGNVQAQQMLNFYKALQVQHFSPMHENMSALNNDREKVNSAVRKCISKKPSKKKTTKKVARNPNNSK